MERDPADIVDRYCIEMIRLIKTKQVSLQANLAQNKGIQGLQKEFPKIPWNSIIQILKIIHETIWGLESAVRQGELDGDLEEVGKRAILIRNYNSIRVSVKNLVNELTGWKEFQEIKTDHISEKERK